MLRDLLDIHGVSGFESAVGDYVLSSLQEAGLESRTDPLGNVWTSLGNARPRLVLLAHLDEIGFVTTKLRPDGHIWARALGNWDPVVSSGVPVEIKTPGAILTGVSTTELSESGSRDSNSNEWLCVDVGTRSEAGTRALGLDVLQPLRLARSGLTAMGDLMMSRALDNRLGSYALLRLAHELAEESFDEGEVILAWTSQEEIGFRGTKALAAQLRQTGTVDGAISIDGYPAKREPGLQAKEKGAQPGAGPVLRGADLEGVATRSLCNYVMTAAGSAGVPIQHVYADGNNQASVFASTAWCAIDYAMTYMHSNAESVHSADFEAMYKLIKQIVLNVGTLS